MPALENTAVIPTNGAKDAIDKGLAKSQEHTLHVVDSRTGKYHPIPIVHNAIDASAFKQFKASEDPNHPEDQNDHGIRVFDPGFSNTAVSESKITYMYVP
jgi:citrate synthase